MPIRKKVFTFFVLFLCIVFGTYKIHNNQFFSTQDSFQIISQDAGWNWYTESRAIRYKGVYDNLYVGWVTKKGDVVISSFNYKNQKTDYFTLKKSLNQDDHSNPSILLLPDKKILAFYSDHNGKKLYYRISQNPESIKSWDSEKIVTTNSLGEKGYTYPNALYLPTEKKLYLFWRGADWEPTFTTSIDNGTTWEKVKTLIQVAKQRPYVKYIGNGKDTIHIAFTQGHPRENINSIYYAKYKNGAFYKTDGTLIKTIDQLPLLPSDTDKVYDGKQTKTNAWVWDIALNKEGNPVIVYTIFPKLTDHIYMYARLIDGKWENHTIASGGTYIDGPKEKYYSAGITLDPSNPSIVYYASNTNGIYALKKAVTNDNGKSWKTTTITTDPKKKIFRPVVAQTNTSNNPTLLWLYGDYIHYTNYDTQLKMRL